MCLAQCAAAWHLHFVLSLIKYTKNNNNNNNTDYLYVYNLCFIGKNKRLYNLYRRLQEQRCWPTDWLSDSANHALLTRKHKQLAECAVTDAAAAAFPLKAWDRGKSNTWPWTESRVRDKQRCEVDFFFVASAVKRQATASVQNILVLPFWNSLREGRHSH